MTAYRLRLATASDAEAICRIYNQGIEYRVATLETELLTPDERRQWLASSTSRHPVIIAERNEGLSADTEPDRATLRPPSVQADLTVPATITGWASLNVFNARECYRFVADISVYVEREWRGKGAGRVLLERLIELGREHEFHKLVLSAFPFNPGGMALYERMGFRTVGVYREQGRLDGRWVDTIVMERLL